ncbi:hypothetical protein ACFZDP_04930 [Streptomyces mirabilis]
MEDAAEFKVDPIAVSAAVLPDVTSSVVIPGYPYQCWIGAETG